MKDDARQEQEIASAWREAVARDAQEAPPPALDAKIRAAARATLAAPSSARRRPRYLAPLALAASVVVAVGLVLRQQRVETLPPTPASVAPAPQPAEPAEKAARAEAPPPPVTADSSASEGEVRAPQAIAPPPPAAAAQSAPSSPMSPSPSTLARERRTEAHRDLEAAAGAAARDATPEVVARIRTLLARGERDAAAALAREYAARRPPPPPLPADLRFLLDDG